MVISILTGILLCFYYNPGFEQFKSVQEITYSIHFGWFIRMLHYISSQVCIIAIIFHAFDVTKKEHLLLTRTESIKLSLSILMLYACSFTGYILKADQEGLLALYISQNLLEKIPLGSIFKKIFLGGGNSFLHVYTYHCFVLPILICYLLKEHIKSAKINFRATGLVILISMLYYKFFVHLHDIPLNVVVLQVYAPWYFWGLQFFLTHINETMLTAFVSAVLILYLFVSNLRRSILKAYYVLFFVYMLVGLGYRIGLWR